MRDGERKKLRIFGSAVTLNHPVNERSHKPVKSLTFEVGKPVRVYYLPTTHRMYNELRACGEMRVAEGILKSIRISDDIAEFSIFTYGLSAGGWYHSDIYWWAGDEWLSRGISGDVEPITDWQGLKRVQDAVKRFKAERK